MNGMKAAFLLSAILLSTPAIAIPPCNTHGAITAPCLFSSTSSDPVLDTADDMVPFKDLDPSQYGDVSSWPNAGQPRDSTEHTAPLSPDAEKLNLGRALGICLEHVSQKNSPDTLSTSDVFQSGWGELCSGVAVRMRNDLAAEYDLQSGKKFLRDFLATEAP